jgi:hypothetical protein
MGQEACILNVCKTGNPDIGTLDILKHIAEWHV